MTNDDRKALARDAKSQLRKWAKVRIADMSREERERADAAVSSHLAKLVLERGAGFVVAYLALADEACLNGFLEEMAGRGVRTLVPRVTTRGEIGLAVWRLGCRLIPDLEGVPSPENAVDWPDGVGLLVVPGRVFDTEGGRVGRGLGYYDRFLGAGRQRAAVAGAAYECQVVERVPREAHDAGVGWLATEAGCRRFVNE